MFYLTHHYREEEDALLRSHFGLDVGPPDLPAIGPRSALRLRGAEVMTVRDGACLWLDPGTASWAVLEGEETALARDLSRGLPYAALVLRVGPPREQALRLLLGHLWVAGLLEVDGRSRWPSDLFARGPLFRASHLVEIHLTSCCNLACRYCFAQSGPKGDDMAESTAHHAVEMALALPTEDLTIEFAGGESLLRFPLLKHLVERIERASGARCSAVRVSIQTNGLLLDGEVAAFLTQRPEVEVGISLDGPRAINDAGRVGVDGRSRHREIEAAARRAVAWWGKQSGALAVIHAASWSQPRKVAAYFAALGLAKMRFNPVVPLGRGRANGAALAVTPAQYLAFMTGLLEYLAETRAFEESGFEALTRNLVLKTRDYRCMRSPCGAGYDYLVVLPSGDIYPCARFCHDRELCLGNINDGQGLQERFLNSPTVRAMADRIVSRLPACRDCLWRHFCEGGCGLGARAEGGNLDAADPLCAFYRGIYPYLIEYLYTHPEMAEHFFPGSVVRRPVAPGAKAGQAASTSSAVPPTEG